MDVRLVREEWAYRVEGLPIFQSYFRQRPMLEWLLTPLENDLRWASYLGWGSICRLYPQAMVLWE